MPMQSSVGVVDMSRWQIEAMEARWHGGIQCKTKDYYTVEWPLGGHAVDVRGAAAVGARQQIYFRCAQNEAAPAQRDRIGIGCAQSKGAQYKILLQHR